MTANKTLNNFRLDGKWALVCGASKGIGAAAARALADLGADVTLVARTEESLKETFQQLSASGTQRHGYFTADFDDTAGLKAALEAWLKRNPKLHILVNNTGGPPGGPANSAKPEEFLAAFNRHLIGGQVLVQTLLPAMKQAGYGRIINVISTSVKEPIKGLGVSNTVRGAVAMIASLMLVPFCVLGGIGWLHIPMDVISSPATNVCIGIAIDSMIHLVFGVRRAEADGTKGWAAWVAAREEQWRGIVYSDVIIAAGFAIFVLSDFPPTQRFGLVVLAGCIIDILANLFVLPLLGGAQWKKKY